MPATTKLTILNGFQFIIRKCTSLSGDHNSYLYESVFVLDYVLPTFWTLFGAASKIIE